MDTGPHWVPVQGALGHSRPQGWPTGTITAVQRATFLCSPLSSPREPQGALRAFILECRLALWLQGVAPIIQGFGGRKGRWEDRQNTN